MYQYKQLFIKIFLLLMFRKLQSRLQTFMLIRSTLLNDWLMQKHLHHHKNVNSLYSYNKVTENDPFLLEQSVCLPPKIHFGWHRVDFLSDPSYSAPNTSTAAEWDLLLFSPSEVLLHHQTRIVLLLRLPVGLQLMGATWRRTCAAHPQRSKLRRKN